MAAALAAAAGEAARASEAPAEGGPPDSQPAARDEPVDAGPLDKFSSDGVFGDFRQQGFFLIRRGKRLSALSSICTHKGCKVRLAEDQSFYCKCHDSEFDRDGKVIEGPAKRNLPWLAVKLDDRRHVLVDPSQQVENK